LRPGRRRSVDDSKICDLFEISAIDRNGFVQHVQIPSSSIATLRSRFRILGFHRLFFKRECPTFVRRTMIERVQIFDAAEG